jgi:hypothetical protein
MSNDKEKTLSDELFEFLVKFEGTSKPIPHGTDPAKADIWNELHVPMFRNFKVFTHQSGEELIIVMPTHVSGEASVYYHVIRENMMDELHNGEYEMLSMAEFRAKYKCNFINQPTSQIQSAKITDLAERLVDALPEIRKLKSKSSDQHYESTMFFSRIILDFLMGKTARPDENEG